MSGDRTPRKMLVDKFKVPISAKYSRSSSGVSHTSVFLPSSRLSRQTFLSSSLPHDDFDTFEKQVKGLGLR